VINTTHAGTPKTNTYLINKVLCKGDGVGKVSVAHVTQDILEDDLGLLSEGLIQNSERGRDGCLGPLEHPFPELLLAEYLPGREIVAAPQAAEFLENEHLPELPEEEILQLDSQPNGSRPIFGIY